MGGCENYGPSLGTLNIRCRILIGVQKQTIILATAHMGICHNRDPLLVDPRKTEPLVGLYL